MAVLLLAVTQGVGALRQPLRAATTTAQLGLVGRRKLVQHAVACTVLLEYSPISASADASGAVSKADVDYALGDLFACRAAFDTVYRLLLSSDFEDATPLLSRPPIARFGRMVADVVAGPGLEVEGREKLITIRADVAAVIPQLAAALQAEVHQARSRAVGCLLPVRAGLLTPLLWSFGRGSQDAKLARGYAKQARNSLDDLLAVCEAGGLFR